MSSEPPRSKHAHSLYLFLWTPVALPVLLPAWATAGFPLLIATVRERDESAAIALER